MISEQFNLKSWIIKYRDAGLNVAPALLEYKSPRGLFEWKQYQTRFIKKGEITLFYYRLNGRDWHIWMHTGETSQNIGVLDIDDKELAHERFEHLFDETLVCETKHGYHFWLTEANQQGGTQNWGDMPIDIRSQGGGVIIPPSPDRTWLGDFDLDFIMQVDSIKSYLEDLGMPDTRKSKRQVSQIRNSVVPKTVNLKIDSTIFLWNLARCGITLRYYLEHYYQGDQKPRNADLFWCTLCNTPEDTDNYSLEYHHATDEFHCYACGRSGGLIEMVIYDKGISEHRAINWLKKLQKEVRKKWKTK